jgi:hypothetical protein
MLDVSAIGIVRLKTMRMGVLAELVKDSDCASAKLRFARKNGGLRKGPGWLPQLSNHDFRSIFRIIDVAPGGSAFIAVYGDT